MSERYVRSKWWAPLAAKLTMVLAACTGAPQQPATVHTVRIDQPSTRAANRVGEQIAATAQQMLGAPYRYGGDTPNGFDCSGLVRYTHASAGIDAPRTAAWLLRK